MISDIIMGSVGGLGGGSAHCGGVGLCLSNYIILSMAPPMSEYYK